MQTITDELAALLTSHLQAAADGFRERVEVDGIVEIARSCPVSITATSEAHTSGTATVDPQPISVGFTPTEAGILLAFLLGMDGDSPAAHDITDIAGAYTTLVNVPACSRSTYAIGVRAVTAGTGVSTAAATYRTGYGMGDTWFGGQVFLRTASATPVQIKTFNTVGGGAFDAAPTPGNMILVFGFAEGATVTPGLATSGAPTTWQTLLHVVVSYNRSCHHIVAAHCVEAGESNLYGIAKSGGYSTAWGVTIMEWAITGTDPGLVTHTYQAKRIDIEQSLSLGAGQMTVEFANEGLPLGWASTSAFPTNSRIRAYQWYGDDDANAVRTFTGIIDRIGDSRDPLTTVIACRDRMAILIDQTHTAIGPQGADETGAVRTEANGVYLNREVDYIVSDILDRWGWPTADRAITPTSYTLAEFIIADGESGVGAIIGESRLTGLVGYDAWADELGTFHFAPNVSASALTETAVPVYTFRTGVDILSLSDEMSQYDLRTRVKVRGPLTTETLTDTWRELWRTDKFRYPVGIWYDPADSDNIRVLDRGTKRLYKLRQSDCVVLSSTYLGTVIPYPLDVSGDPSDASVYWVLNCPWKYTGSTTGNSVKKVTKATNAVAASYSLPDGRWTALKVSSANLWLTNWDTDRLHKRSKADGTAAADYGHSVGGVTQTNPSGLMVDGTTLHVFWSNSGTTARFLICSETAPGTVTKVITTAGTVLVGGEMDTTTHTACWGCSDSIGLVAKFTLVDVSATTAEVFAEVVDSALEDELGTLAQTEPRIHDTHPGDPAHPWMIRRETITLDAVISLAQATETAGRRLDKIAHRSRVLDFGILGNPAVQKTDLVRVEDPVTGIGENFLIDTHRSGMAAESTYAGTIAGTPVVSPGDVVTDDGDAT